MSVAQCFVSVPSVVLIFMLLRLPAVLLAGMAHEHGHALMSMFSGDDTARRHGYLTLNPVRFADPFGFTLMMFCGFGWSRQVPVNVRKLRHGRLTDSLVTLSGFVMNLLVAVLAALLGVLVLYLFCDPQAVSRVGAVNLLLPWSPGSVSAYFADYVPNAARLCAWMGAEIPADMSASAALWQALGCRSVAIPYVRTFFSQLIFTNIGMAVFNLLPVPPLDMFHLINDNLLHSLLRISKQAFLVCVICLLVVFAGLEKLNGLVITPIVNVARAIINVVSALVDAVL